MIPLLGTWIAIRTADAVRMEVLNRVGSFIEAGVRSADSVQR